MDIHTSLTAIFYKVSLCISQVRVWEEDRQVLRCFPHYTKLKDSCFHLLTLLQSWQVRFSHYWYSWWSQIFVNFQIWVRCHIFPDLVLSSIKISFSIVILVETNSLMDVLPLFLLSFSLLFLDLAFYLGQHIFL